MERKRHPPLIIAHRGASTEAPENTLSAIKRALSLGVDGVEMDLQMTADHEIAVFHDDKTGRTCKKKGPVCALPSNEVFSLDAGSWFSPEFKGEKIPSLEEVLKLRHKAFFLLELKSSKERAIEMASNVLLRLKKQKNILLSSFCPATLEALQILKCPYPRFAIASSIKELKNFGPVDGYALHHSLAKSPFAKELFKKSTLFFWTVDSQKLAFSLIHKAHGLITNKPHIILGMKEYSKKNLNL